MIQENLKEVDRLAEKYSFVFLQLVYSVLQRYATSAEFDDLFVEILSHVTGIETRTFGLRIQVFLNFYQILRRVQAKNEALYHKLENELNLYFRLVFAN